MPKELSDKYNIQGMLGPVIFNLKSKELIDSGKLAQIKVVNTFLNYPEDIKKLGRSRNYHEEIKLIETTPERNYIFKYIFDNISDGENSIILVDRLEHLDSITEYIEKEIDDKYSLYVINGSVKPEDRERIRKTIDSEKNVILVATYGTVSTGINIKRIHNVVLASSSKSEIRILQSIGRGLRTHDDKSGVIIWDIIDDFSYETRNGNKKKNHTYGHWEERYKYYNEQEFPVYKKTVNLVGK
jgi:superfamily II DNA or RNA helicase